MYCTDFNSDIKNINIKINRYIIVTDLRPDKLKNKVNGLA